MGLGADGGLPDKAAASPQVYLDFKRRNGDMTITLQQRGLLLKNMPMYHKEHAGRQSMTVSNMAAYKRHCSLLSLPMQVAWVPLSLK